MIVFVLDTNVLCLARDFLDLSSLKVLNEIFYKHSIALDKTGLIKLEYRRNDVDIFSQRNSYLRSFWKHMERKGRVIELDPILEEFHRTFLIENGFDDGDMVFIEVAYNTKDKLIITNDSDFGIANGQPARHPEIGRYLENELEIRKMTSHQAEEFILSSSMK